MPPLHTWDLTPKQAVAVQRALSDRIRTDLKMEVPKLIAGVDVAYLPESQQSVASVAVLSFPELELVDSAVARTETPFPYVPGLLSFREIPAVLPALDSLQQAPDLIFVDGHGRAHPRRFGIASHLGLWLGCPTIGIGKKRLCGDYAPPGPKKGAVSPLRVGTELIGVVLRSRSNVQPIYVSVGYGIPLEGCLEWVRRTITRYRLPEPIRWAHKLAERGKSS